MVDHEWHWEHANRLVVLAKYVELGAGDAKAEGAATVRVAKDDQEDFGG